MSTSASARLPKTAPVARPATTCSANWLERSEPIVRNTHAASSSTSTGGELAGRMRIRDAGVATRSTAIRSVAEVALAHGFVLLQLGARPRERDLPDLEHVRLVRGLQRDVRVLLDDEHRRPLALVQLLH